MAEAHMAMPFSARKTGYAQRRRTAGGRGRAEPSRAEPSRAEHVWSIRELVKFP